MSSFTGAQEFHSSPECWAEPRVYHSPLPPEVQARFHTLNAPRDVVPQGEPVPAPNARFRFWVREVSPGGAGGAGVIVDVDRSEHTVMLFESLAQAPAPQWISQSLLYMRIPWGRMVSSDLVFDADTAQVIYHEAAIDGSNAWQQFREACFARCPCAEPSPARMEFFPASHAASDEIIGLLEMPGVFDEGATGGVVGADNPLPVAVHSAPMAQSRLLLETASPGDLEYREYGYEQGAASVYERLDNWYRVKLSQGGPYGWVAAGNGDTRFHPASEVLQDRLNYLTAHWDGLLWENPPAAANAEGTVRHSISHGFEQRTEYPAVVTETKRTANGLWLKVGILREDPCSAGPADSAHAGDNVLEEGWIPAYSGDGKLTSWFYARGC